jgi:hypothetical protein
MSIFTTEELESLAFIRECEQRATLFKLLDIVVADKARAVLSASIAEGPEDIVQRKAAYEGVKSAIQEIKRVIESAGKQRSRVRKPR